jgi:hypothetical protein
MHIRSRFSTRLALVVLLAIGFLLAPASGRPGEATTFTWPTTPYLRDAYGNYAFRSMTADWWGCSSNWCWYGPVTSYVHIVAQPQFGYHYDSAGVLRSGSGQFQNNWNPAPLYLDYYNTPRRWTPDLNPPLVDLFGTVWVHTVHCETVLCYFIGTYASYGNLLSARFEYNTQYPGWQNCNFKQYPYVTGC